MSRLAFKNEGIVKGHFAARRSGEAELFDSTSDTLADLWQQL